MLVVKKVFETAEKLVASREKLMVAKRVDESVVAMVEMLDLISVDLTAVQKDKQMADERDFSSVEMLAVYLVVKKVV